MGLERQRGLETQDLEHVELKLWRKMTSLKENIRGGAVNSNAFRGQENNLDV